MEGAKKLALAVGSLAVFVLLLEGGLALAHWALQRDEVVTPTPDGVAQGLRVVALGDSFSFGIHVDPAESYPAQLSDRLRDAHGARWRIQRTALPGLSPLMIHRDLDAVLDRTQPELVLLLAGFNVNDADILEYRAATGRDVPGIRGLALRANAVLNGLRSYRVLRNLILRLPLRGPSAGYSATKEMELFDFRLYQEVNRWALDGLVAEIQERGLPVVLLNYPQAPVPTNAANEADEYYYVIFMREALPLTPDDYLVPRRPRETAINAVIRDVATRRGVPLADNFAAFQTLAEKGPYFLADDEHPNARGYALMAETVAQTLAETGWIEYTGRAAP
ncbi:MAG: GDSL-type esterase/lipase family protein [Myxococcota bacterium]